MNSRKTKNAKNYPGKIFLAKVLKDRYYERGENKMSVKNAPDNL